MREERKKEQKSLKVTAKRPESSNNKNEGKIRKPALNCMYTNARSITK